MKITNTVAVITGGASGLGRATVERLAAAGARVSIFDLNAEAGSALATQLGDVALFTRVDVADEASVAAGIDATMAKFGALHICVNCAGIGTAAKTYGKNGPFPLADFNRVIQVNLVGTFNVLRLAVEQMAKHEPVDDERGVIVNIASVAAFDGQMGQAAYSASKGGIVGMTLPIARDLAALKIRCNTIAPGLIHTPLFQNMPANVVESLSTQPLHPQRLGRPDEVAQLVQAIVENAYLNAETIRLDGGIRMPAK